MSNPDGHSGHTWPITDEHDHQIPKSTMTIYDVGKIITEQQKTITGHKLGHAFELAHSTAREDRIHPVITTDFPDISDGGNDAI